MIYIFGIDFLAELPATQWLMYVAAATILLAALVALQQDNLNLRLAWSLLNRPLNHRIPLRVLVEAATRYIAAFEQVSGQTFEPDFEAPVPRIERNLGLGNPERDRGARESRE